MSSVMGMDRLEHPCYISHPGLGHNGKHISVKMDGASLVFCLGEHLPYSLQHSHTPVPDDQFYSIEAASPKPLKEVNPAGLIFFTHMEIFLSSFIFISPDGIAPHQYVWLLPVACLF